MIRHGVPYTNENGCTDGALLTDLPEEEQKLVLEWIRDKIRPIKGVNIHHSSYGMKHILEHDTGIYLTNNQFKHAMLISGHEPDNARRLNWLFRISEKSPAFRGNR